MHPLIAIALILLVNGDMVWLGISTAHWLDRCECCSARKRALMVLASPVGGFILLYYALHMFVSICVDLVRGDRPCP